MELQEEKERERAVREGENVCVRPFTQEIPRQIIYTRFNFNRSVMASKNYTSLYTPACGSGQILYLYKIEFCHSLDDFRQSRKAACYTQLVLWRHKGRT